MYRYAEIENNIVKGIAETPAKPEEVKNPVFVFIGDRDVEPGDEYNPKKDIFTKTKRKEPMPEPTTSDIAQMISSLMADMVIAGVI